MPTQTIKHRLTGTTLYECEAESVRIAVEKAAEGRAFLTGAVLRRADLTGAVLSGAVLTGADLRGADLTGAALNGAVLTGAVLTGAVLTGADLRRAALGGAVLNGAVLTGAVLNGAVLTGADLRRAALGGADLCGADLCGIKADLFAVLAAAPAEVPALLAALRSGRVDGSAYTGECACLVGTIANARHCSPYEVPGLRPDSTRPAERWFLAIRPGDTPATNPVAAITEGWITGWMAANPAPDAAPSTP